MCMYDYSGPKSSLSNSYEFSWAECCKIHMSVKHDILLKLSLIKCITWQKFESFLNSAMKLIKDSYLDFI